jgi:predicted PurR-regulated permease PerM
VSSLSASTKASLWWVRWVPAALLITALIVLTILIGGTVVVPLLLSFAIAFMLEPIVDWFERRGRSRQVAVLLTLLATLLTIVLVFGLLLPSIYHQFGESVEKLPLALRATGARVQSLLDYAQARLSPQLYARLQVAITNFQNDPSVVTSRISAWLSTGLFGLVSLGTAALGLLIVPFFVYYLLLDMDNLRRILEKHIPTRHRGAGVRLLDEVAEVVRGYVRGRFLIALIMAVIYAVGLLILGVPLWAAIGLIAGIIGIIPYIGVVTGFLLAVAFAALDGAGIGRLAGILGIFVLAQILEDYVLTPRIIGNKLDVHPMLVFIALIIGGDLFGLLGLVLAIPVLGVLKVLLRFIDELYLRSHFYTAPEP